MVKNLPANAGDVGSIPGQGGKTLHTEAAEPVDQRLKPSRPETVLHKERSRCNGKLNTAARERPCAATRPSTVKNK